MGRAGGRGDALRLQTFLAWVFQFSWASQLHPHIHLLFLHHWGQAASTQRPQPTEPLCNCLGSRGVIRTRTTWGLSPKPFMAFRRTSASRRGSNPGASVMVPRFPNCSDRQTVRMLYSPDVRLPAPDSGNDLSSKTWGT